MQRLKLTTLREQAIATIRNAILANELKPGDPVSLRDLAERLDTSVAPIREAVQVLEQQGLLERGRGGRLSVVQLTAEAYTDGIFLRANLEKFAVQQAIERASTTEWEAFCIDLDMILTKMETVADASQWKVGYGLDIEWHTLMIHASQNSELVRTWRMLGLPARYMVAYSIVSKVYAERLWTDLQVRQHRELLAVLKRRNHDECVDAVYSHVLNNLASNVAMHESGTTDAAPNSS